MTTTKTATYHCEDVECGKAFEAAQGSKRHYCPDCTYKRVIGGKKLKEGKK